MIKTPKGDVLHFEQLPHFYSLLKTVLISLLSEHRLIMGRAWPGVAEFTRRDGTEQESEIGNVS